MKNTLIISPQSGFGNRLRALNSAIIIAQKTKRTLVHAWMPMTPTDNRTHVSPLQRFGIHEFFESSAALQSVDPSIWVDQVLSEWASGDYWFSRQNSAQRLFRIFAQARSCDYDHILSSSQKVILVETSRRLWPPAQGFSFDIYTQKISRLIHHAYRLLIPRSEYSKSLSSAAKADIGIHIRRGDILNFCPQANQNISEILSWLRSIDRQGKTISIFSDDSSLSAALQPHLKNVIIDRSFQSLLSSSLPHQAAFLTFLYLATKCSMVYGTPGSSFSQEAALYGGIPYAHVLGNL